MTDEQNQTGKTEDQDINLLELLQVIVKRKAFIIKLCSVAIVASVIYSLSLTNIYSATAKILPPQKDSSSGLSALLGAGGGLAGLAGLAAGGLGGGSELYLGILKSRSVADGVIQRLDLAKVYKSKTVEETRKSLDGAVKVQVGKDGIISITAQDKDPVRSALLANTFVDELGKTTVRLNLSKAGTERVFLEKRLALVKKDLKTAEDDLKAFAQLNKIVQVDSQARATIEGIARLKAELASKEVQLAVLRSSQTDQNPDVKAAQTGISRLKGELSALTGSDGSAYGIPSIGNVPGVGLDYLRKMREVKTQEAIFEQLTKQYEIAKINEAKDTSSFQILDEAVVPIRKSTPSRALIVILTTMAAFFISVITVFIQNFLAKMSDNDKKIIAEIKKQSLTFRSTGR